MDESFLDRKLEERRAQDAFRRLRLPEGKVDFCSNDYLGIATQGLIGKGLGARTGGGSATAGSGASTNAAQVGGLADGAAVSAGASGSGAAGDADSGSWAGNNAGSGNGSATGANPGGLPHGSGATGSGWPHGSGGSRLLAGNYELAMETEKALAAFHNAEAGILFNSGYDANLGVMGAIPQKGDIVLYDELCHASIRDGMRLSFARNFSFTHNDCEALAKKLEQLAGGHEPMGRTQEQLTDKQYSTDSAGESGQVIKQVRTQEEFSDKQYSTDSEGESGQVMKQVRMQRQGGVQRQGQIFVVTESVFSMDGDMAPLAEMAELCSRFGAGLIVDEAHATGVTGKKGWGLVQELGLEDQCLARVHTFGKAVGCHGAIVLGSRRLIDYLVNFCRPLIYTTALPPASVAAIAEAYRLFPQMDKERAHLETLIHRFHAGPIGYERLNSRTPIQAVIVPGNAAVRALAEAIQEAGIDVRPILYPTVPAGKERLRIVLHAFNTVEEIDQLMAILAKK